MHELLIKHKESLIIADLLSARNVGKRFVIVLVLVLVLEKSGAYKSVERQCEQDNVT